MNDSYDQLKEKIIWRDGILLIILSLLLSACTSVTIPTKETLKQHNISDYHIIENVPVIQQKEHYCGPAALATLIQHSGLSLSQDEAAEMVYTQGRKGTFQHDIISAIQRLNLLAVPVRTSTDLMIEIADNHPVLIFQNLGLSWYPMWHYSVITGYDLGEEDFYIHDGRNPAHWRSMYALLRTWKKTENWGYIAVKPGTIPKTATLEELLQSTAQLEVAGFLESAKTSYKAMIDHFPNAYAAHFGLGNVAMAQDDPKSAEKHYQDALKIKADWLPAINNLAYAYDKQNKTESACALLKSYIKSAPNIKDSHQELCL